ncbi:hypothetical protein N431DRAFT_484397 [Stipitochalara longipes BDJ]|nr:hypothetical protein N431DRAFT_484397 [Stipitochalara longipes BDJ]
MHIHHQRQNFQSGSSSSRQPDQKHRTGDIGTPTDDSLFSFGDSSTSIIDQSTDAQNRQTRDMGTQTDDYLFSFGDSSTVVPQPSRQMPWDFQSPDAGAQTYPFEWGSQNPSDVGTYTYFSDWDKPVDDEQYQVKAEGNESNQADWQGNGHFGSLSDSSYGANLAGLPGNSQTSDAWDEWGDLYGDPGKFQG